MATDPVIQAKADDIRTKVFGSEVRESLASGLEAMSEVVVDNTNQFQQVIENTTGKDVISAPEIIAARNNEANLKARLDKEHQQVTAQLAQTAQEINVRGVNVLNPPPPLIACKGDGTDETSSFNAIFDYAQATKSDLIIPETTNSYKLSKFQGRTGVKVIGLGKPKIELYRLAGVSVTPLLGLSSNSTYENIWFNCLETNLEWNRGELSSQSNVILRNCRIEGFLHTSGGPNAWGLYLDESKNITIDNCEFENNSQADIAIVEGCENVTIINARGSNLHLNFEPNNGTLPIRNILVKGGNYKKVELLENDATAVSVQSVHFDTCIIDALNYRGGYATFTNCEITTPRFVGWGTPMAGSLDFGGAVGFGENLIKDPKLLDVSNNSANTFWNIVHSPHSDNLLRKVDELGGLVLVLNPLNRQTNVHIRSKKVDVSVNKTYFLSMISSAKYPSIGSSWIGRQLQIVYNRVDGTPIRSEFILFNRSKEGTETPYKEEGAFIQIPEGCTNVHFNLLNTSGGVSATNSVSVSEISFREVFRSNSKNTRINRSVRNYVSTPPSSLNAAGTNHVWLKGEILYNENPTAGGYLGWICLASGNPGTWRGFGLIQS